MFELSLAFKYLLPKWRQLSLSIISLISIIVIALVIWLIVVFFSVTSGLQKNWISKLITLTAPIRLTPTEDYYRSFYYLIDTISESSQYSSKSIREKKLATKTNPHDPLIDEEIPREWLTADVNESGELKDIIKETFAILNQLPEITTNDFEMTAATLQLELIRQTSSLLSTKSLLTHQIYLGSFENRSLENILIPPLKTTEQIRDNKNSNPTKESPIFFNGMLKKEEFLVNPNSTTLPQSPSLGYGLLLPKGFREAGARLGDLGHVSYLTPTASALQEQKIPIFVTGFYDPGLLPLGGKFALASPELVGLVRSSQGMQESVLSNGINVYLKDLSQVEKIKASLLEALKNQGLERYWSIQTYKEYEFTKDLLLQLQSEGNLFTLLSLVILLVACSNIISMLIILVNDKKMEIGILRSMGASPFSIAFIFGFCGFVMGALGSLLGLFLALLTLRHLTTLVDWISALQGHELLNPLFFGDALPKEISIETLIFVLITTGCLSIISGVIPSVKACLVSPSVSLKEGAK